MRNAPIDGALKPSRNRNRNFQTSKAPLESQAQGTSLSTSANQVNIQKISP
jgi:hypothetical protein